MVTSSLDLLTIYFHHSLPSRCFSWRFPHSLCTDSFHFLRNLLNSGATDDRPITAFYHEKQNRSLDVEEELDRREGSQRKRKQDGTPVSELETASTTSAMESGHEVEGGETLMEVHGDNETTNTPDKQKNEEVCHSGVSASSSEQTGDPSAQTDPPDVSDMMQFSMDSPGGACVVSLTLMSMGLLSVHISIPNHMVVVDSSLVDNDVVKR